MGWVVPKRAGERVRGRREWGGSDAPVEGEAGLEGDEGELVADEAGEAVVELAGVGAEGASAGAGERTFDEVDGDAGLAEAGDAAAADQGIGVGGGDDDAGDLGADEGFGAGAGAAGVGAGFEGDVGGGGVGEVAGLAEGDDFGMVELVVEVGSAADDGTVTDEDAAYGGVGGGQAYGSFGEAEGLAHPVFVGGGGSGLMGGLLAGRGCERGRVGGAC
jgi:hypothetical protein